MVLLILSLLFLSVLLLLLLCLCNHLEVTELVVDLAVDVPHAKVALVDEDDVLHPERDLLDLLQNLEQSIDLALRLHSDHLDLLQLVDGHLARCGEELVAVCKEIQLEDASLLGTTP